MCLRSIQSLFLLLLRTTKRNDRCEVERSLKRLQKILKNGVAKFVYLKQCCVHEIELIEGTSVNGQEELRSRDTKQYTVGINLKLKGRI